MGNAVLYGNVFEDQAAILERRVMARDGSGISLAGEDGFLVQISDVASLTYSAFTLGDLTQQVAYATGTLDPSVTLFDSLQPWPIDATGYNFSALIPESVFADMGNKDVRILIRLVTSGGAGFNLVHDLTVTDVTPNMTG